jgi:hypothetical protein
MYEISGKLAINNKKVVFQIRLGEVMVKISCEYAEFV